MQPFFQWVSKNAALSFLFGAEIISLIYGFVLIIASYGEDNKKIAGHSPVAITIIADEDHRDLVNLEMKQFAPSPRSDYQIVITSRENALKEFAKNEHVILILSKQLSRNELEALHINSDRLPLQQEVIDNSAGADVNSPVFVRDSKTSIGENKLAAFLNSNRAQDVVFQKLYQRSSKGVSRKG